MTFWGRLSVRVTSSWPLEVICLWITTFLRLSVLVGYQLMTFWGCWNTTFWGRLSVRNIGFRGRLSLWEYQLMTFWGRLPVWNIGLCRLSLWNTSLWPSEVVCLCGILDYDLFEVVCPFGIPAYDLLRSFACAEYRITTFLRSFVCVGYWIADLWGHLSVAEYDIATFSRSFVRVDYDLYIICLVSYMGYDLLRTLLRSLVYVEYQIHDLLRSFVIPTFYLRAGLWEQGGSPFFCAEILTSGLAFAWKGGQVVYSPLYKYVLYHVNCQ
jgi:hypothetical protein